MSIHVVEVAVDHWFSVTEEKYIRLSYFIFKVSLDYRPNTKQGVKWRYYILF